jgi:asparagine synthetase B (glutamine-hydrolysing)
MTLDETTSTIKYILLKTIESMSHKFNNVILFSGGVDSLLVAVLLNEILSKEKPIYLINTEFVTKKISSDRTNSILAANELKEKFPKRDFCLIENNITHKDFLKHEDRIKKLIYPKDKIMDMNIGTCLFFGAMSAAKFSKVVFLGCGADELFCGYNNHKKADVCLKKSVYNDVSNLFERNLGRDDRVISDNNVEARYPFLTEELIEAVLKINPCYLLDKKKTNKIILRKILEEAGFCRASKLKKTAMQYGSGINKWEKRECKNINKINNT